MVLETGHFPLIQLNSCLLLCSALAAMAAHFHPQSTSAIDNKLRWYCILQLSPVLPGIVFPTEEDTLWILPCDGHSILDPAQESEISYITFWDPF